MSAKNSNLTTPAYAYDLVCALSQNLINSNLKTLLNMIGMTEQQVIAYYRFANPAHSAVIEISYAEAYNMFGGADPFIFKFTNGILTPATATEFEKKIVKQMIQGGFAYAFKAAMGIPDDLPLHQAPDIVVLNPDSGPAYNDTAGVQYSMYFRYFQILRLEAVNETDWTLRISTQNPSTPWSFMWRVGISQETTNNMEFDRLPQIMQKKLREMYHPAEKSPFSLFALGLAMHHNVLHLIPYVGFFNIPPTDPMNASLGEFANKYWTILARRGGIVLCRSAAPAQASSYPVASIIPTALSYMKSPYQPGSKKSLDTLCYLVMDDNRPMVHPKTPFNWNWVDDEKTPGVMASKASLFIHYLSKALSPCLKQLCMLVEVKAGSHDWSDPELTLTPNTNDQYYKENAANPCLDFYYSANDEDKSWTFALYPKRSQLKMKEEVTSKVTLTGNRIDVVTRVILEVDYDRLISSTNRHYPLAKENKSTFTMEAVNTGDNAGLLHITQQSAVTDLTKQDGQYKGDSVNFWKDMVSWGKVSTAVDEADKLGEEMDTLFNNYVTQVSELVNGTIAWVFPGNESFFFSNPSFSNTLDLTVDVDYRAVN